MARCDPCSLLICASCLSATSPGQFVSQLVTHFSFLNSLVVGSLRLCFRFRPGTMVPLPCTVFG